MADDQLSEGQPQGTLSIRTLTMPADTNPAGDIFGGWVMSQMDIAGSLHAVDYAAGRVVTVAVDSMTFVKPVKVGDVVCCYTDIVRVGRTSITVNVEAWALRGALKHREKVTEARFVYVAMGADGKPKEIEKKDEGGSGSDD